MTSQAEVLRSVARLFAEGPWLASRLQRARPYICPFESLVDLVPAGAHVLDVGCGSGLFLSLLAEHGQIARGLGFDVQARAIDYANNVKAQLRDPSLISFVVADSGFEWPKREFDLVSMVDVMHHVAPAEQLGIFGNVADALRPGGLFLYKDMVTRPHWRAIANRMHDLVLARQWIHYLPMPAVIRAAEAEGFRLVEASNHNRWWYGHEMALFRLDAPTGN